ncbi:MAG: hypothetical protein V3V08_08850 [Nannocystaceae bacterium]
MVDQAAKPAPASGPKDGKNTSAATPKSGGWLRNVLGWVVLPGALAGGLVLLGVHVGANHGDMWLSRLVKWLVSG